MARTSSQGSSSRQQRRAGLTRTRIVSAAQAIFAEQGLAAATVDKITERADVGRGSFYYHFKSLDALIEETVERVVSDLIAALKSECSGQRELDAMMNTLISTHIRHFDAHREDFVLYYQGRAELILEKPYDGLHSPYIRYIQTIQDLVNSTLPSPIAQPRSRRLASAIAGFISGYYSLAGIVYPADDDGDEFALLRRAFVSSLSRVVRDANTEAGV